MVIVLIGPPGCGKGTQSRLLTQALNVPAYSTGEILRAEVGAGSELGKEIRGILHSGGLVSDDLVNRAVAQRLPLPECANGVVLDGYPRTLAQAEFLDHLLSNLKMPGVAALHFEIDEPTIFSRLSARRYCPVCGRTYNVVSQPPAHADFCDDDGMVLMSRKDDHPDVIRERMTAYESVTMPVLRRYRGRVHRIDASRPAEQVLAEIESRLALSVTA